MIPVTGQSFNRDKTAPLRVTRRDLTGPNGSPVFENRARAADAHATAELCSRQSEGIPQNPHQRRVVIDIDDSLDAVHRQAGFDHVLRVRFARRFESSRARQNVDLPGACRAAFSQT